MSKGRVLSRETVLQQAIGALVFRQSKTPESALSNTSIKPAAAEVSTSIQRYRLVEIFIQRLISHRVLPRLSVNQSDDYAAAKTNPPRSAAAKSK